MCKTWPYMDHLLEEKDSNDPHLEALLRSRYDSHAGEYITGESVIIDGEPVPLNACMQKDTFQDIEEELVDAIFNGLVLLDKVIDHTRQESLPGPVAARAFLAHLVSVWDHLENLRLVATS